MFADPSRLPVVLCWHMHQPDYRGPGGSDYRLPWVYLHALKDYSDMAAHLEAAPQARAVVNFAPVLLEQIEDYAAQIAAWQDTGRRIRDPLLAALAGPGLPADSASRREIVAACRRANQKHLIDRFPCFSELIDLADWVGRHRDADIYLSDQYLADLLVWYHLAWTGEHLRTSDERVIALQKKGRGFDPEDRRTLLTLIAEQLASIVPRYRRLAESGQVELSVTPYAHPILPLLLDIESARQALPQSELPALAAYPGGEARARWHIARGIESFERHFGHQPAGCWPAEGAVCEHTARLLEEAGFRWAASGQQVLHNSLLASTPEGQLPEHWLTTPYRIRGGETSFFFRDDGLSDLIGFTYGDWHAEDAVANLIEHLEHAADATQGNPHRVISIIMDGENAWEYYPHNGSFFLSALYRELSGHPRLELTTFSQALERLGGTAPDLERLVAGSWVYGNLSTWIGDPDKNRAWDMLGEAKSVFDRVTGERPLEEKERERLDLQLATCEGSDWFWWFGDNNPAEAVSDFERLYRRQLQQLYELLGQEPPDYLDHPFTRGGGSPERGGVMKKS
jgi:alpha-amylase/alpha-mannosidase (GH57 family)